MNSISEKTAQTFEVSDETLMQAIINREQTGLDQLYARYRPLINKIVAEILPNGADAEEALQDVFMEIWNRAANFDVKKGKPLGWIICMARRRAIDHYRKIRRRAEASEKLRLAADETPGQGTAHPIMASIHDDRPVTADLRKFLLDIIRSLPAEQGSVIHMSYFNEMSQREIALRTGIPLGTIKTRLDLALRKLTQKSMPYRAELSYVN